MSSSCKNNCKSPCATKVKSPDSFKTVEEANAYFLSMVSLIATKHGCRIDGIDETTKPPTVLLAGPEENQVECAFELGSILKNFLQ